jgi:hypothetical protein
MAISQQDKQRIIKLLELSTSSNDNEALLACRRAYAILEKHNLRWHSFFCEEPQQINKQNGVSVEAMFAFLYDCDLSEKQIDFLNGLSKFYRIKKKLTEKQLDALTDMFFYNGGEDA